MAHIKCTIQEYHHYLGPRIRNAVQGFTKKTRDTKEGVCEHCGNTSILESAHIHGKGRRTIIEEVLQDFTIDGYIDGDLKEIESRILSAHMPIEEYFMFLCKACHNKYDSTSSEKAVRSTTKRDTSSITIQNRAAKEDSDFTKISRIKNWAVKEHQDNHKIIKAYFEILKKGSVTLDQLKSKCSDTFRPDLFVQKFNGNFASMKSDNGNSHGKVFYEENGCVKIYEPVMVEIRRHFKNL